MNNKIINDISSEVYIKISERLKAKKKKLKLTREQIFFFVIPLVSRALNNRRIKNKNPYLLTPTLADAVVKIMKFKSTYELVWGEKEERQKLLEHFLFSLFEGQNLFTSHAKTTLTSSIPIKGRLKVFFIKVGP